MVLRAMHIIIFLQEMSPDLMKYCATKQKHLNLHLFGGGTFTIHNTDHVS